MGFPTRFSKISMWLLLMLFSTTTPFAQATITLPLPDTVWIDVTFFDFHSDGSNPEFECDHRSGTYEDMAATRLPDHKRPQLGTSPYMNHYFKYWYVGWDSADGGKGDFTLPFYDKESGGQYDAEMIYDGSRTVNHDTAFRNIVIKDSLPFILVDRDRGLYRYEDEKFFPLDDRGFEKEGRNHNFSFTMSLHTNFTYKSHLEFTFEGDDDVWTYINNTLALDLGGIHLAERGVIDSVDLRRLGLTLDEKYDLDFYYAERHTSNSTIMIETNLIQPEIKLDLSAEPDIVVPAGTVVKLKAEVKSSEDEKFPDFSKLTKWKVVDPGDHSPDDLDPDSGETVNFSTHIAYDTIKIEAYIDIENAGRLCDTITIITIAGPAAKIYIEDAKVTLNSDKNLLRNPHPIDTVYIPEGDLNPKNVFAVVRDTNGAFVRMADPDKIEWSVKDEIVKVKGKDGVEYQGIIERFAANVEGVTKVKAEEEPLIADDVPVVVSKWYPVKLRLVLKGHSVVDDYITKITIETDSSEDYEVYAFISTATDEDDLSSWVKIPVDWDLSSPLDSGLVEAENSINWTYSPIVDGEGTLTLVNPHDNRTAPLTIPVEVTVSAPRRVEIKLITHESERIVGQTLRAEVRIFNGDDLVRGTYCFGDNDIQPSRSIYQDTLSDGGRPDPKMMVDEVTEILNTENGDKYKHNQCFQSGIDTVDFVLYYAPRNSVDSFHQISVLLRLKSGQTIKGSTVKFSLLAGPVKTIELTHDRDGLDPIIDTIVLKKGSKVVYAHGYDEYGNYTGPQDCRWNTDGQLPPVDEEKEHGEYYNYVHSNPLDTIKGNLCASIENTEISACAAMIVTGQDARISKAITRDINGNGYLDRIVITFSKGLDLTDDNIDNFSVICDLIDFKIEHIVPIKGDSVYALNLKEQKTESAQTDWIPRLTISGVQGAEDESSKLVDDGAAPVVWSVVKDMPSQSHKDDIVTIILSEDIEKFNTSNSPDLAFWVYVKNSSGDFTKVDLFNGAKIIEFDNIKTIKIAMLNGYDLSNSNWVNIRHENELIYDIHENKPDSMNRKVNVRVNPKEPEAYFGPNPFRPSNNIGPGKIKLSHDPYAFDKLNQGGTVLIVNITVPEEGDVFISLKIYDVAGNLVNYSEKTSVMKNLRSLFSTSNIQSSQIILKYLWHGHSNRGMKAAPGVYKGVISIDYESSKYSDKRIVDLIGVQKSGILF